MTGGSAAARPQPSRPGMVAVVLASASTGRLAVLRAAGIEPTVLVSGVDEDHVRAQHPGADPSDIVSALAQAKADAVVHEYVDRQHVDNSALAHAVVIAADSMLLIDGELQGKPHTPDETRRRWAAQSGRTGTLLTGHAIVRVESGEITAHCAATAATTITMGTPTPAELAAYIDSGEPLEVAGALTIDGLGGWFVESIDGDPSCVIGLSLPLTRRLLSDVGITVTDLWHPRHSSSRETSLVTS